MRWKIVENKRKIATENFEGHFDRLEMSGEQVSAVIGYGVKDGLLSHSRQFTYPMFRLQPNNTHASYAVTCSVEPIVFDSQEKFRRAEFDGVLTLYSQTENLQITRRFFPSTQLPIFYEEIELLNNSKRTVPLNWKDGFRFDVKLGCEGYIYAECQCDKHPCSLDSNQSIKILFSYGARFANSSFPTESDPLSKRRKRVLQLLEQADLTTGDDVIDTMFAFSKLRAGESLFRTEKGLVHSPGGMTYYAAVWCNDECEYVAPWFAFTGDEKEAEATINAFRWYEPFMNDDYLPIPSSIIAQGRDYWNGAGDRGDAAMYLYGLSRFLLTRGELPDEGQKRALNWCKNYIERKITAEDVVFSDTDELENRLSSGVNLSTSSLAYGALRHYAVLLRHMGEETTSIEKMCDLIKNGIENYFGTDLHGYHTYRYHDGCKEIRAWNCLPVYMGIFDRADDTLQSIDQFLWKDSSCCSTEGEKVMWDRSALYYIASLFRAGKTNQAWERLREYSENRLLGDHVPYAVEAYPEGDMRHLSGESALYCRVITDGLLGFDIDGGILVSLPSTVEEIKMENVYLNGEYRSVRVK